MLALKKKREAEAAAVKAAAAAEAKQEPGDAAGPQKVSLFGIGGEKKTKNGDSKTGKKRTPGEIRIQKGKSVFLGNRYVLHWHSVADENCIRALLMRRHCRVGRRQGRYDRLSQPQRLDLL
jgi:hypothetical protein